MKNAGEQGFGLMEAIVSLAIVTLGLAAFCQAISGAYRAAGRMKYYTAAIATARTQLESAASETQFEDGTQDGTSGVGIPWRLTVTALGPEPADTNARTRVFRIVSQAFDRKGKPLVKLQTYRLSSALTPKGSP